MIQQESIGSAATRTVDEEYAEFSRRIHDGEFEFFISMPPSPPKKMIIEEGLRRGAAGYEGSNGVLSEELILLNKWISVKCLEANPQRLIKLGDLAKENNWAEPTNI